MSYIFDNRPAETLEQKIDALEQDVNQNGHGLLIIPI